MGYSEALEAAGAKVLEYKQFGSYQGDWLAFVEYNGEKGIAQGSYGSCSGCDAFEAEFSYYDQEPTEENGKYYKGGWADPDDECTKEEYDKIKAAYQQKLSDFGLHYLSPGLYDKSHYEQRLLKLNQEDWFDEEEKEYIKWAISREW